MARDGKKILDESVGAFKRLTEQIKEYKNELATLTAGTAEWNETAEKLRNAQKQVDAINKAAKGTLVDYNKAQANSINALKEKIKLLNQERNAMDMNSKEYADATKELKVLNDQLREAGTSAGDWRANVGNYANSIKDAFGELGGAATALTGNIGGLNAGMLKLASNPVGAVIVALTSAIAFLAKGIKSSEENTNRWNMVLVPLRTVLTMIERAAQEAAKKFLDFSESMEKNEKTGKVVRTVLQGIMTVFEQTKTRINNLKEGITEIIGHIREYVEKFKEWANGLKTTFQPVLDFVTNLGNAIRQKLEPVINWIIDKYNWLAKSSLGKIMGLQTIEQVKKSWTDAGTAVETFVEEYKEVETGVVAATKASNRLAGTLRNLGHQAARLESEIAAVSREYAEALEQKDYEKAQDALNRKSAKEVELAKVKVAMAEAQLNVIRKQNALSDSNTKDLDAEAAAMDEVTRATAEYDRVLDDTAKQQRTLNNLMNAEKIKQQAEAYKEAVAALNQALNKITNDYNKVMNSITKPIKPEGGEINRNTLNAYYDQVQANANAEYEAYKAMTDAKIAELERFIEVEKAAGNNTLQYETQLAALRLEQDGKYAKQHSQMMLTVQQSEKERVKTLKALQKSELQGYANFFDAVSGLFEQNTIAYKATATAKALINTYLAASSALAETPGDAIAKAVAMAATIANGIAQVYSIWKVDPTGESNIPTTNTAVAEPSVRQENPYTYTRTVQTYEEEDKLNQPMFVSVTDINNVQNRVRVTEQESSF